MGQILSRFSGGTNKGGSAMEEYSRKITLDNVQPLIEDYEILIKTLSEQLDYYKKEQDVLRNDIVILLNENKQLSSYTKDLLEKTDQTIYNIANHKHSDGELIENLKLQINALAAEKESTLELWRTSLSTIDHLEEELRLYEGRSHGFVPKEEVKKIIVKYERITKQLEMEIARSEVTLADVQHISATTLDKKEIEMKQLNDYYQASLATIKNLEGKLYKLKTECAGIKEKNLEIEKQNYSNKQLISELRLKESQSKMKVNEAVHVVEAALMEKDAALLREQQLKEEMAQMAKMHSKELENMYEKYKNDVESANKMHDEDMQALKTEIKMMQTELKEKNSELDLQIKTTKIMEERMQRLSYGAGDIDGGNKMLILEKNLESTFQKLLISEKRNIQLEAEKQSIKDDLAQMSSIYERESMAKESEKRLLETKVTTLQNELECSNSGIVEIANKVSELNGKIGLMESEVKKQLVLNDIKHEKILANKIREIEDANSSINNDLQAQLQTQINFNLKWKDEVKDIMKKLEARVYQLKEEVKTLKEKNKELNWKLSASEHQIDMYKNHLVDLCVDVKKIATISKEHISTQFIQSDDKIELKDEVENTKEKAY